MVGYEFLAGEHRRVVDHFIEDAVGVLAQDMPLLQRNELEVKLRFYVETQMAPSLLAVTAVLLKSSPDALQKDLPEWTGGLPPCFPQRRRSSSRPAGWWTHSPIPCWSRTWIAAGPIPGCADVPSPAIEHGGHGWKGRDVVAPGNALPTGAICAGKRNRSLAAVPSVGGLGGLFVVLCRVEHCRYQHPHVQLLRLRALGRLYRPADDGGDGFLAPWLTPRRRRVPGLSVCRSARWCWRPRRRRARIVCPLPGGPG